MDIIRWWRHSNTRLYSSGLGTGAYAVPLSFCCSDFGMTPVYILWYKCSHPCYDICQGITYSISIICMSTHKASIARCLCEHQAWSRQPAIQALLWSSLRRLALSMLFTSQSTSYQTTCTVSERSSIKGTHQCKPTQSSSFTLWQYLVSISTPPCGTLYTYT